MGLGDLFYTAKASAFEVGGDGYRRKNGYQHSFSNVSNPSLLRYPEMFP